jgi:hypothetical protein
VRRAPPIASVMALGMDRVFLGRDLAAGLAADLVVVAVFDMPHRFCESAYEGNVLKGAFNAKMFHQKHISN